MRFHNEEKKTRKMNVEEEIQKLVEEIHRLGSAQSDGSYKVTFGVLLNDERCANIFEALVETLIAAKERNIVAFVGELLLQGGDQDHTEITLLRPLPQHEHSVITLPQPPLPPHTVAATS